MTIHSHNITSRLILAAAMLLTLLLPSRASGQVNTDQVMRIGQNALYFEDYMLSIQYFNQAIAAKPYMAQPYFLRSVAKINLDDFRGAEADASKAIELNPFLTDAYEVRGVARQNLGLDRAAIEDYDNALRLLPRNRQLLFNKALAQTDIEDYSGARETFDELLRYYPSFDNGYLGRARLLLATADTTAAAADIDRALELDRNDANAYIMRADIAINSSQDYNRALDDIEQAIRLLPNQPGLYINRAFLRYQLDSYNGAMADYDYALTLDPLNRTALFNRALLLAEVSANDLALEDFNRVLELDPDDYRALYNRALINQAKGNYSQALDDIDRVAERFPDFPGAAYMRGNINRDMGRLSDAERDYDRARRLTAALPPAGDTVADDVTADSANDSGDNTPPSADNVPEAITERRFKSLLTIDDNATLRREYNNSAIRGRVQDRNMNIEIEPYFLLSFYSSPSELRPGSIYIREVDDLNATRMLRFILNVANNTPSIDQSTAANHFQSIDYYNSYLATHQGRPVDYIGRALDFLTVRDYLNAERDATRALDMASDLAIAYIVRAQARYGSYLLQHGENTDGAARIPLRMAALDKVEADLDSALAISPATAVVWFNKGNILYLKGDISAAIEAYSKAIECKPDFGEAYFNRGFMYLRQGSRNPGIADLSKAGELGILPAYNLIKRISTD